MLMANPLPDIKDQVLSSIIRINDLVNVLDTFPDFKEVCCSSFLTIPSLQEEGGVLLDAHLKIIEA